MKLKDLKTNAKNPRILKDARFKKLLNKVLCYPNLLSKNKLTYDSSNVNTVLGGNQRLATLNYIVKSISTKQLEDSVKAAQKALGLENELLLNNSIAIFTEIKETKSIPSEWVQDVQGLSEDEKQAFILIDNLNDGEWDLDEIANKWDIDTGEWGLVSWNDFNTDDEVDYSILDGEDDLSESVNDMSNSVKKAIQIEFDLEHYEAAYEVIKFWRGEGANIGKMILDYLESEKDKL
jgi:hypothetical protein